MTDEIRLAAEIIALVLTLGTILWRLSSATTTFTLIGNRQADEIREMKISMDKMETAVTAIAVQDVKLVNMDRRLDQTDKRNDDRFKALEQAIDDLRRGKSFIKNGPPS
jgi:small-conductance mechanosensitive channel